MKKILLISILVTAIGFASACSPEEPLDSINSIESVSVTSSFNNNLRKESATIIVDYNNLESEKAVHISDPIIDLENQKFYSASDNTKEISKLICGDVIDVYFSEDESIDHILVNEVTKVEIRGSSIPGAENIEFFSDETDAVFVSRSLKYIINEDGSCRNIDNEVYPYEEFYGTYDITESTQSEFGNYIHTLKAVYSYMPR